jgi:hypothetical protein
MMKRWDGTAWSGFESLGSPGERDPVYPAVTFPTPLAGPPTVCSWGPDRIDVFARGIHGDALHRVWNGEYWSEFQSLGMPIQEKTSGSVLPFTGVLTACSWGLGRLDVFGRAIDGQLYHAWWDGDWDHDLREPARGPRSWRRRPGGSPARIRPHVAGGPTAAGS